MRSVACLVGFAICCLVEEPAPGEQYVRMAAGNTRTAVQQNTTEEEYESRGRAAEGKKTKQKTSRETTNLPKTNSNEGTRMRSAATDPRAG